jgi:hypothetical protein
VHYLQYYIEIPEIDENDEDILSKPGPKQILAKLCDERVK